MSRLVSWLKFIFGDRGKNKLCCRRSVALVFKKHRSLSLLYEAEHIKTVPVPLFFYLFFRVSPFLLPTSPANWWVFNSFWQVENKNGEQPHSCWSPGLSVFHFWKNETFPRACSFYTSINKNFSLPWDETTRLIILTAVFVFYVDGSQNTLPSLSRMLPPSFNHEQFIRLSGHSDRLKMQDIVKTSFILFCGVNMCTTTPSTEFKCLDCDFVIPCPCLTDGPLVQVDSDADTELLTQSE